MPFVREFVGGHFVLGGLLNDEQCDYYRNMAARLEEVLCKVWQDMSAYLDRVANKMHVQ